MKAVIQDRPVVMVFLNSFGKHTRVAEARRIRKWMEFGAFSRQLTGSGGEPSAGSGEMKSWAGRPALFRRLHRARR